MDGGSRQPASSSLRRGPGISLVDESAAVEDTTAVAPGLRLAYEAAPVSAAPETTAAAPAETGASLSDLMAALKSL